uniref:NADH-ubiquinone oxidoreductase chain 2 n=1 Tax=Pedipes pedipes TaxID=999235 RepID=G8HPC1_9EUPU|nr:NADH dehydrogenase subunit 2 [Pedipes pedipes]AEQ93864.1 NADH dehydrogenase subunit 2 [Pedipes pedipes]
MSSAFLVFFLMVVFGSMISISSGHWVLCWTGMELAFLGLLPFLLMGKGSLNSEYAFKYFAVQAAASVMLFIAGSMMFIFLVINAYFSLLFLFSVCVKLGIFPGHFWVMSILTAFEYPACFLLLVPMKIPSLFFLYLYFNTTSFMCDLFLATAGLSALVGALLGINQTSIRGVLEASSISHSGWLGVSVISGKMTQYFLVYSFTTLILLFFLFLGHSFMAAVTMLSLGGLPPFLMFIAKYNVVSGAIYSGNHLTFLILPILGSALSMVFYLKFSYNLFLSPKSVLVPSVVSVVTSSVFLIFVGVLLLMW